jgi:lysophospholipase L1-like esterase
MAAIGRILAASRIGRHSRPLLAFALALALAGVYALVRLAESYYRLANEVRLDPAGLKTYEADRAKPAAMPAGKPLVLFFGDSRALMWRPPPSDEFTFVDRGVAFQTTAQIILRLDADLVQVHPTVVVVEAGVNDLKAIAELPQRRSEIIHDCEENIRHIVRTSRDAGASVVLTSVFSIGDLPLWRKPFWDDDVDAAVREVNVFLRTLAGPGVVFFDADPVLDDARGRVKPAYQYDFLHLVPAGYDALDEKLFPLLREVTRAR